MDNCGQVRNLILRKIGQMPSALQTIAPPEEFHYKRMNAEVCP